MSQNKRQLGNRDSDEEPSTSTGSSRHLRKKKSIPGQGIDDDNLGYFDDSDSDWEATQSETESFYLEGGNTFANEVIMECSISSEIVIRNTPATDHSTNNMNIMNSHNVEPLPNIPSIVNNSGISLGETSNLNIDISNTPDNINTTAAPENTATINNVWTLEQIREFEESGSLFTVPRRTTVRQSGKVTSQVWESFDVVGIKNNGTDVMTNFAKCKKCLGFVQFCGSTTTQLKRHKCDDKLQPKISQFIGNTTNIRISKDDVIAIRDAASKFISIDIRPFTAVDGEGLRMLVSTVAKVVRKYKTLTDVDIDHLTPHRSSVTRHVVNKSLQARTMISNDLRRALDCPGSFSCTTDLYSDCFKCNTYLGITASLNLLVDGKIEHKRYVINLDKLDAVRKSGANIWTAIKKCFLLYNITEREIIEKITWVTDRGSNITNALEQCSRLSCYAHIINNIVKYMCDEDAEMKKIVSNASSLVRYMKMASIDKSKLKSSLKSFVDTRWNTVFYMLLSIVLNFAEIYQILDEKEKSSSMYKDITEKITCFMKPVLERICNFLEVFKDISLLIEGDKYETIHQVWPAYLKINSHLQPNDVDHPIIQRMKELGRNYIEKHKADIQPKIEHKVAVFLHPLMKRLSNLDDVEKESIIGHVESIVLGPNEIVQNNESLDLNLIQNQRSKSMGHQLFDGFIESLDSRTAADLNLNEVRKYINFPVDWNGNFDEFNLKQWWEQHQLVFPKLFLLFMRIYVIPASSASSERAFSTTGRILDARRSSLKPSTMNQIMLSREFYLHTKK